MQVCVLTTSEICVAGGQGLPSKRNPSKIEVSLCSLFILFGQRNSRLPVGLLFTSVLHFAVMKVLSGTRKGKSTVVPQRASRCVRATAAVMGSVWFLWMKDNHWRGWGGLGTGTECPCCSMPSLTVYLCIFFQRFVGNRN